MVNDDAKAIAKQDKGKFEQNIIKAVSISLDYWVLRRL